MMILNFGVFFFPVRSQNTLQGNQCRNHFDSNQDKGAGAEPVVIPGLRVMLCPRFGMEFSKWALSAAFPCADGGAPAALEGIPPDFLLTPLLRVPGLRKGRVSMPAPLSLHPGLE